MALRRPPLDRVVPALRHVALAARADAVGRLPGALRPVALRALPAARPSRRVGRGLDDDAVDAARERRRRGQPGGRVRAARERRVGRGRALPGRHASSGACRARSSSACATAGRSTTSRPGASVEHRVVPWDEVSLEEGTGIVHIATGCGGEDFELGKLLGLPVLTPVDEAGRFYDDYGWLHGLSTTEAADQIVGDSARRGFLVEAGDVRAPLPALLALRHAADLADLRRLVHRRRGRARRSCSRRTRPSSGCRATWASAWTTGCATWATGTSRAAATTGCRCRSTRARADT